MNDFRLLDYSRLWANLHELEEPEPDPDWPLRVAWRDDEQERR